MSTRMILAIIWAQQPLCLTSHWAAPCNPAVQTLPMPQQGSRAAGNGQQHEWCGSFLFEVTPRKPTQQQMGGDEDQLLLLRHLAHLCYGSGGAAGGPRLCAKKQHNRLRMTARLRTCLTTCQHPGLCDQRMAIVWGMQTFTCAYIKLEEVPWRPALSSSPTAPPAATAPPPLRLYTGHPRFSHSHVAQAAHADDANHQTSSCLPKQAPESAQLAPSTGVAGQQQSAKLTESKQTI